MRMKHAAGFAVILPAMAFSSTALAQAGGMSRTEAMQLYAAGGFPISADGKNPTNRCGKAANPTITFVDFNGDGRKDALFIDQGSCYGADGRAFGMATKQPDGSWRGVAGGLGTVKTTGTTTNGWFDLAWTSKGKTTPLRYDGARYSTANVSSAPPAAAKPAVKPAVTPPGGDAAIFLAAGFRKQGAQWKSGCDDPGTASYSPGVIESRQDLNGDGRPEAIVTEGGTYCFGNTGTGFWLVSQQADGSWKLITNDIGIPEFQKTKGVDGWPDIEIGGPGFCFPVQRWNGKSYVLQRHQYEGKPCRP